MFEIHVVPKEAWTFILANQDKLEKERVVVASNDAGVEVCFTTAHLDTYAIVYDGDKVLFSEKMINDFDAEDTLIKVYEQYLGVPHDVFDDVDGDSDEDTRQELEDEIYEREDALFLAAIDFLTEAFCIDEENDGDPEKIIRETYGVNIEKFIDAVMELIAKQFFVSVYRPTFIPNEDSPDGEVLEEFPYEEMANAAMEDFLREKDEKNKGKSKKKSKCNKKKNGDADGAVQS